MKASYIFIVITMISLAACGQFNVSIDPIVTATPTLTTEIPTTTATATTTELPTQSPSPTVTLTVPSPTLALPTATQAQPTPTQSIPPTSPSTTAADQIVKIVLIALEDNGQSGTLVGCGDSAVPINVTIPRTQGVLRAALEKLLSAKQEFYGESGYYNALYQSDLRIQSVTIEQRKAIIHLAGTLMLGGTCDAPRVEA